MWECGESVYVNSARKASDSDLGWSVVGLHCFVLSFFSLYFFHSFFLRNKCIITSQVRFIARQWSLARRYKCLESVPSRCMRILSEIWESVRFLLRVVRAKVMEKKNESSSSSQTWQFVLSMKRVTRFSSLTDARTWQECRRKTEWSGDDVEVIKG